MKLEILYSDNHLLVVNKPAGLLSQKDKTGDIDLLSLAGDYIKKELNKPGNAYVGLVHRLDRPASGVMVLARTSKAASRLSARFREGAIRKQYLAAVEGSCRGQGSCIDYIVKKDQIVRVVKASYPKAQRAELSWASVAHKKDLSLLDIQLKTGRPHQVRVQLAHMGFPVLGDLRYGAKKEFDGQNLALHCYLVGLEHPTKKEFMQWTAKPPASWEGVFDREIEKLVLSTELRVKKQIL